MKQYRLKKDLIYLDGSILNKGAVFTKESDGYYHNHESHRYFEDKAVAQLEWFEPIEQEDIEEMDGIESKFYPRDKINALIRSNNNLLKRVKELEEKKFYYDPRALTKEQIEELTR